MAVTSRTITGRAVVPAQTTLWGTVSSSAVDNTVLIRTTATAWVSGGPVVTGQLVVFDDRVWRNRTGTNTANEPDTDPTNWEAYTRHDVPENEKNIYIYVNNDGTGNHRLSKVKGVHVALDSDADTYIEQYECEDDMTVVGSVNFGVVKANLVSWSCEVTLGTATINGESVTTNGIRSASVERHPKIDKVLDPILVDGTGASVSVLEQE